MGGDEGVRGENEGTRERPASNPLLTPRGKALSTHKAEV